MLTVLCMKWGDKYGSHHVNVLESMLSRHLDMDYELVCITDDPHGVECRTLPLWEDDSEGCFRRLDLFRPEIAEILGPRFVSIDLDCVIVADITPLFQRDEDFVIWQHPVFMGRYCGSMFMMDSGARAQIADAPRVRDRKFPGTDQEVISNLLPDEAVWTAEDGVHTKLMIRDKLPRNARIVFYPGPRDPSTDKCPWAVENWR